MITEPGIYDLDDDAYHADPVDPLSASCSILQLIDTKSPLHAMWAHPKLHPSIPEPETKFDFGTAFHTMMMGVGKTVVPVNALDWRTKEAKAWRDDVRAQGKTPVLHADFLLLAAMVEECKSQLQGHDGAKNVFYEAEKSLIWKEDDYFFRIRPDWLSKDTDIILDLKATKTSAAPEAFQRHIFQMFYDFRAAFYARGYQAVTGRPLKEYRFVACEVEPPHALSIFSLTPEAMAFAAKRVDRAVEIWKECLSKSDWPGYSKKVVYVTPPRWAENAQIEREINEAAE